VGWLQSNTFVQMGKSTQRIETDKIRKKVARAIHAYQLFGEDDRVLLGISGGIDSLVMLDILANRRKYMPIRYHLEAIHVYMQDVPNLSDRGYIEQICNQQNINLHQEGTTTHRPNTRKSMCFNCSWNRRKTIFNQANELGCNKIAFAHHMDDALETLLMNMTFHGEMSSFPPKLSMFDGRFDLIRPLILVCSEDIEHYAAIRGIRSAEYGCPYEKDNHREQFRGAIDQISQLHPQGRINLYNAMGNIYPDYLPGKPTER